MAALYRSLWLAALAAAMTAHTPAHAKGSDASNTPSHRTIRFNPNRAERCDYFFVTEFDGSFANVTSEHGINRMLYTDSFGLMRNIGRTRAVGASINAHLAVGRVRLAPTVRFKQWLAGRQSIDLSLGYTKDQEFFAGVQGPIFNAAYSPTQWVHVQAGACRIRTFSYIWDGSNSYVKDESPVRVYAGVGIGGAGGAVSWGAQAIGFVVLMSTIAQD